MWGFLRLLCIVGLVTSSAIPKCIPSNVSDTHRSIATLLNLTQPEVSTSHLFTPVINASCQRRDKMLLMNATLDVYIHILSSILKSAELPGAPSLLGGVAASSRPQVEEALGRLKGDMQQLQQRMRNPLPKSCEDVQSHLQKVKVDDPTDQRKALAQFKEVYKAAVMVMAHNCNPIFK